MEPVNPYPASILPQAQGENALLPPKPRPLHLVPIEYEGSPDNLTELDLSIVGPVWQDLSPGEQNALVHRLLYPEWDPKTGETPRNYVGDLDLLRLLFRWTEVGDRLLQQGALCDAIHRCIMARLALPYDHEWVIPITSGLSVLEASDVAYALLATYGDDRKDLVVPRYRYEDAWRRRGVVQVQKAQAS